jgi:predicted ribosomally synthesized peptide with SipW-like signal peptide
MSEELFDISRRRLLAGLGTVGLASAGAGLGTSAYFSDEEEFTGNQLVAGSLDMKVDWEEHYSDWSDDESDGVSDVVMTDGDSANVPAGYVGLPDPATPLIAVPSEDLGTFMDNTSIEAFPDPDNDGAQEVETGNFTYEPCTDGADTPEDLVPGPNGRTDNDDTVLDNGDPAPLINLGDIKPGDFGEVTFSFHLCDNPGYVWLNGALRDDLTSENGLTEPEMDDPDEDQTINGTTGDIELKDDEVPPAEVELLDEIQTTWWYDDDGDNVLDSGGGGGGSPCVQIVLDASGSMSSDDGDGVSRNQEAINGAQQLADEIISNGGQVGVTFFSASGYSTGAQLQQSVSDPGATDIATTQNAIANLPANGNATAIGEGILTADEDLANCPSGTQPIQVVITDGGNTAGTDPSAAADDVTGTDSDDYTEEIFAIGTGGTSEAALLEFARPADDVHAEFTSDLTAVIANISQLILGEKVIFRGSLREALGELSSGQGIPLDGNRATAFDEFNDPATAEGRDCFVDSVTHYIGFAWYLPVDHANEIQTDSVGFDLGFYTEQCRHNDGAGMPPEQTPTTTPGGP